MAKKTRFTEEYIDSILLDIKRKMLSGKWTKGEVKISRSLEKDERKATIAFTPVAWLKTISLINQFSTEVQWHGLVKKESQSVFCIYDILVPPHTVSASTVISDEARYSNWAMNLDISQYCDMKFHGHSHVNMGCNPSGVDETYREKITGQLPVDDEDVFYIFMIFNKSLKWTAEIYDPSNNALYETADVDLVVRLGEGETLTSFISHAKEVATEYKAPDTTSQFGSWHGWSEYKSDKKDDKKDDKTPDKKASALDKTIEGEFEKKEKRDYSGKRYKPSKYDADSDDLDYRFYGYMGGYFD